MLTSFKEKIKKIFNQENIYDINFLIEKFNPNKFNISSLELDKKIFHRISNKKYKLQEPTRYCMGANTHRSSIGN